MFDVDDTSSHRMRLLLCVLVTCQGIHITHYCKHAVVFRGNGSEWDEELILFHIQYSNIHARTPLLKYV